MPRIYTSASDPLDFCRKCFPSPRTAEDDYGHLGDGPDGRGNCYDYESDHPPYSECDYTCEDCGEPLTSDDD